MRDLIVLTGPTAVGKTELSLKLAQKIEAEIISTDSMQIYQHMDIGTAKATKAERDQVEHYLIDFLTPEAEYSVSRFQDDCDQTIAEIKTRDKMPMLVGGTHLYLKAVLEGFMLPEINPDYQLRQKFENLAEDQGTEAVHDILAKKDEVTAKKLHPNDLRRVIRAIEIYEQTGKTKSYYKKKQQQQPPRYSAYKFALIRSRENLYQRINNRVELMMESGLLDEVKFLLNNFDNLSDTAQQALGYKELISYLKGETSLEKAVYEIKKRSRHFAKRQLTWLRKENNLIVFNIEKENKTEILNNMVELIKGEKDYEEEYKKRKEIDF
ncbi:tRNA dimethylallyltransferase [Halanaerobium saccharolyticum]|uniref:tRNA dimethylallyltransferase n=1 Tax=Halanaerobium saccharolyticum TaxID=43595 RepID=A0A4R7Z6R9_9FIRM|nr:tRNA (adenosine(37)-N6)-dimethylallyltransferase MiaA [Halanaerobium saccharolyticum]RAK11202.1 tRNA dimethylallyltransferase [Halanaerobium saccharolyticum]TDW07053.1 tRNA dimethylallyltransferase [Halanaerobium saccharolyticum]TDX63818.1 tRNA dimethylallyltransferase [Halanaerobium saccharolyticum]